MKKETDMGAGCFILLLVKRLVAAFKDYFTNNITQFLTVNICDNILVLPMGSLQYHNMTWSRRSVEKNN